MSYKLSVLAAALITGITFSGCGGGDSTDSTNSSSLDLPDGKTLLFYSADTTEQYSYDTDTDTYTNLNIVDQTYDMEGKSGKLYTWFDPTDGSAIDQKIVMFKDTYSYAIDGNVTFDDFHYLGHFHTEDNTQVFAAHSANEFDPDNNASTEKLAALTRLSNSLNERELQKEAILNLFPLDKELCNYLKIAHTDPEDNDTLPYFAMSGDGEIYVYEEDENGTLSALQSPVLLDGVTECSPETTSILQYSEAGILVFSAQTQKLYLVDNHGGDFHQHASFTASKFLPNGFVPTQMEGIGKGEDEHDHE